MFVCVCVLLCVTWQQGNQCYKDVCVLAVSVGPIFQFHNHELYDIYMFILLTHSHAMTPFDAPGKQAF